MKLANLMKPTTKESLTVLALLPPDTPPHPAMATCLRIYLTADAKPEQIKREVRLMESFLSVDWGYGPSVDYDGDAYFEATLLPTSVVMA